MRRLYFSILFVIISFQTAKSQETLWGVKGGMNVTDIGKKEMGYVTRLAWHAGGFGEFIMTPFVSIQIELMYSLQGAATDASREVRLNYHYANLPIFAKIYFLEDASFELGIQYGYLVKAIKKTDYGYTENLNSLVNRNDFSLVLGFAYNLGESIVFDLRYNMGISDTRGADIIYELRRTNRVLQLSFGYIF